MTDIPRSLSADDTHPLMTRLRVYVDGDEIRHVTAYDIDKGTVTHLVHADNGHFIRGIDGRALTRIIVGRVTVAVKPE